jgi:hypothetical protein
VLADERLEGLFRLDLNATGIARSGQRGWITAVRDPGDLGGREGHDLHGRVVPVDDVEVVKVPARRSED